MEILIVECRNCNGIMSEVPFDEQTQTMIEYKNTDDKKQALIDFLDKDINPFPECEHCGKKLTPNLSKQHG